MDEVTLEEPSDRQKRGAANGDDMEEDDEEGRGPGVQCAQRELSFLLSLLSPSCGFSSSSSRSWMRSGSITCLVD